MRAVGKPGGAWDALQSCGKRLLAGGPPSLRRSRHAQGQSTRRFPLPGLRLGGDPEHGSSFPFCEDRVKAVAWEATDKRVSPSFFRSHTVTALRT